VQEAVDAAATGDEVRIASGSYVAAAGAAAVVVVDDLIVVTGGDPGGVSGWRLPGASYGTVLNGESARWAVQIAGEVRVGLRNLIVTSGGVDAAAGEVAVADYPLELDDGGVSHGRFAVPATRRSRSTAWS